jgi:hypothetical protein
MMAFIYKGLSADWIAYNVHIVARVLMAIAIQRYVETIRHKKWASDSIGMPIFPQPFSPLFREFVAIMD